MALNKCPQDSKLRYSNKFCKEMQKSGIRIWCKTCPIFNKEKDNDKK